MSTSPVPASAHASGGALAELAARWRAEVVNLRGWGACGQADAVERCAAQLEAVLAETEGDTAAGSGR